MQANSLVSALSAIALGGALGWVLQRGRFCLNSAFRDIIFMKDLTLFRSYLLAVVVAIVGANFLEEMKFLTTIHPETGKAVTYGLLRQNFMPAAHIIGGFLFGMGIVLAGGCASGIVYRMGEGQVAAIVATIGFFFGVVMTQSGMLSPAHKYLKSLNVDISGITNPALWDIFGSGPLVKWITIAVFTAVAITFIVKGNPRIGRQNKGYSWALTGVLIGALTSLAWWVSSYFGGIPRGFAITTPIREFFSTVMYRSSYSPFPEFSFFGIFKGTWGVFFIFAVPLGAFFSAYGLKEFRWKIPPAKEFMTVFFGSIIMGIGAVIAGGCNLGHGITGFSTMALSSILAISAIILGNWTMVYFKIIRPMNDMDL